MAAVQHRDWAFLSHSDAEKHAAALDVLCRNAKHSSQALDLASKCSDLFDTISSTREADGNIAYIDAAGAMLAIAGVYSQSPRAANALRWIRWPQK